MISSNLLNFLIFWLIAEKWAWIRRQSAVRRVITGLVLLGLFWALLSTVLYLCIPIFYDHAEAQLASLAAHWLNGGELYHPLEAADRYASLYGPVPMLLVAGALTFGRATLFLAKIPGVLSLWIPLIGFYRLSRRELKNAKLACFATAALATMALNFYNFSYWIRPDSFLFLFVFLGLAAVQLVRNPQVVILLAGFLAGLSLDCKIHAGIYFAPMFFYWLESKRVRFEFKIFAVGILALVAGIAFPFLLPRISSGEFWAWIHMPLHEDFLWAAGFKNISFMAPLLIIPFLWHLKSLWPWTWWSLLVTTIIVGLLSAKPGSGLQLFLPMVPFFFFLCVRLYSRLREVERSRAHLLLGALFLTIGLNAYERQKMEAHFLVQAPKRWQEFADLKALLSDQKGPVEMGDSDVAHYESTFYRPWMVQRGFGFFFDPAAVMEMHFSGMKTPEATYQELSSCAIAKYVLPKGEPWAMTSFYNDPEPLFSARWKEIFSQHYRLVKSSEYFDLYECQ